MLVRGCGGLEEGIGGRRTTSRTRTLPFSRMTSTPIWLGMLLAMAPTMAKEAAMMLRAYMLIDLVWLVVVLVVVLIELVIVG